MRKLSFLMALLMILLCMPVAATTASAVEEASVTTEYTGKGVDLTIPDGCSVAEANATGFVWDGETKVFVDTLTNAAAIAKANIGKQVVFYLTKTYEASKTIGYGNANYAIMDLSGGANLVIDGQGEYSILNTSTAASNPGRLFRFDNGDGTGILGFRNITLNTGDGKAGGCVEFGNNSLSFLSMKNVTLIIPTTNAYGFVIKCNAELDNVTRDCKSQNGLHLEGTGKEITIKNSTFTNAASVFVSNNSATLGKIDVDGLTVTNVKYNVFDKIKFQSGDGKGIFIRNANVTGQSAKGNALCDVITGNITLYSAELSKMSFVFDIIVGDVIVYDVIAKDVLRFIFDLTGDILVENADVVMSQAFYRYIRSNANIVINGGSFVSTGDCIFYFDNKDSSTITVNGGEFTVQLANKNIVLQLNNGYGKSVTINGGVFNSWNKNTEVNDTTFAASTTGAVSIIQSTADIVNINGGIFNLYSDAGQTLTKNGIHTVARGTTNKINITGGTFNGGQYVNVTGTQKLSEAYNVPMPELAEGQTNTCYDISISTTKGASIRTATDSSGIRFQGKIGKYAIDYMTTYFANGANVYSGVAIVPSDYLEATNGVFTFAALEEASLAWATTNAANGKVSNSDGSYTINLALSEIKEGNYNREFVAIAYIYADVDGDEAVSSADTVFYASTPSEARSVSETAKAALADVKASNEGEYITTVTGYYYVKNSDGTYTQAELKGEEVKYSRFNTFQLAVLKKYA